MSIFYREFQQQDTSSVIQLMDQLGYQLSHEEISNNINYIREKGGEVIVAVVKESNNICGCICIIIDARLAEGIQGEIVSLVVDKNHQSKGIGKGLVTFAENWLKPFTNKIRVRTNEIRKPAHQFYRSKGYSVNKKQTVFIKTL